MEFRACVMNSHRREYHSSRKQETDDDLELVYDNEKASTYKICIGFVFFKYRQPWSRDKEGKKRSALLKARWEIPGEFYAANGYSSAHRRETTATERWGDYLNTGNTPAAYKFHVCFSFHVCRCSLGSGPSASFCSLPTNTILLEEQNEKS